MSGRLQLAAARILARAYDIPGHSFRATIRATIGNPGNATNIRNIGGAPESAFALIPFTLTDPNVAAGQLNTNALLEVETFVPSPTDPTLTLLAVFYSTSGNTSPGLTIDSTTGAITGAFTNVGSSNAGVFNTPEPSGLALLALGAGGVLARRQRRKAA